MAYNGKSKRIKNALITLIGTITYDTGGGSEPAFAEVRGDTVGQFAGYPSVRVLPADLSTDKASVTSNDRTMRLELQVHVPLEATAQSEAAAYNQMYDLTDLIIDTLDTGDYSGALNTIDPAIATYIMNATRGDWEVREGKGGMVLVCYVDVEVKYSKDLT